MLILTLINSQLVQEFLVVNLISTFVNEYQQLFVYWVMTTTNYALRKNSPEEILCMAKLLACTMETWCKCALPLQATGHTVVLALSQCCHTSRHLIMVN